MKPVIGIVTKYLNCDPHYGWSLMTVSNVLRRAIYCNGGIPIAIMPQTTELDFQLKDDFDTTPIKEQEIADLTLQLDRLDGVILQGGAYTSYYEEFIAKYCHQKNIPLLGICAGYNTMIRALGGTTRHLQNTQHEVLDKKYAHPIVVTDKQSLYYKMVGSDNFWVNSLHVHIGDKLPQCLTAVAYTLDGQIEVVEDKLKTFYIGIKHHPELLFDTDEKQNNIFKTFINICTKKGS